MARKTYSRRTGSTRTLVVGCLLVLFVPIAGVVFLGIAVSFLFGPAKHQQAQVQPATPNRVTQTPVATIAPLVPSQHLEAPLPEVAREDEPQREEAVEVSHDDPEVKDNIERDEVKLVVQGDLIYVLDGRGPPKAVRLRGIDAPESGQAVGAEAKSALSKMVLKRDVEVRWIEKDHSNALIADVYLGDEWVNLRMVHDGLAWYDGRSIENDELREAQRDAKAHRRGIWAIVDPIPPWEFRKKQHAKEEAAIAKGVEDREAKRIAKEHAIQVAAAAADNDFGSPVETGGGGGGVNVRGHYRTSKTGKTYYVRPHTRSR